MPVAAILATLIATMIIIVASFTQLDKTAPVNTAADYARALLVTHQAARGYTIANPGYAGIVPAQVVSSVANPAEFTSCAGGKMVATYYTALVAPPSGGAVVVSAHQQNAGDLDISLGSGAASVITAASAVPVPLPCAIPAGAPVVFTQYLP
jgi:hypothetical protein